MNANELADKIEDARNETDFQRWANEAPDMLRQQQAEIENLKAGLLSHHDIYPVKELTDEVKEALMDALSGWKYIRKCHGDLYGVGWDRVQDKLEAILRKAQEK
jgi:aminoglycoside phosphotransferase family enzyme